MKTTLSQKKATIIATIVCYYLFSVITISAQIKVTTTGVTCNGCTDGTATVSVEGGTPPYKYIWHDYVDHGNSINNLAPGYYVIVVVDANDCTGSAGYTINDKPKPPDPFDIPIVTSKDPNDIIGPAGYGDPKWISINDVLPYMIRFENDPKVATAAVNKVVITHPIDNMANMFSFQLGSFSFRSFTFNIPPNTSHYFKRLNLVDSIGVYLDVTAGIDVTKKQAFWIFQAFDPVTGLPNINPDLGFLLINDSITHKGEGSVNFSIKPKSTAHTGDTIKAYASIVFDVNAPLLTNTAFNTIDARPPSSKIKSITPLSSDNIEVTWNGSDDANGSGVGKYNLLISVGNEPYTSYESVSDTSFIVNLSGGNEYRFQTIAKDNTNNTEKLKLQPDTILNILPIVRLGNDMSICVNDSIVLNAGSAFNTYLWNDGSTNKTLTVKTAGKYFVTAIKDTIVSSDTIIIGINPLPIPSLHNNVPVLCEQASLVLNAGNNYKNYLWNTLQNSQTINISSPGKYFVTVTDKNGCQGQDSISITMLNKPLFSLGNDSTIDDNDTIVLIPKPNQFISYLWNDNSINDTLQVIGKKAEIGKNNYWVKVTDSNNCTNSDTIVITVIATINIEFGNADRTSIYLYPNPTVGMMNLRIEGIGFGDLKLELVNMDGLMMMVKEYKDSRTIITDYIDMTRMASGPYILKVTYKGTEMSRTIIKL